MIQAGKLRTRIEIQAATAVQSASGEETKTWATSYYRWAEKITPSGNKKASADSILAVVGEVYRIRYLSGLTTEHRVKIGARILTLSAVIDPTDSREELLLSCSEVVE